MKIIYVVCVNKKDEQNYIECVNEVGFGFGYVREVILFLVKDVYFEGFCLFDGYKDNKYVKDLVVVFNQVKFFGILLFGNVGFEKYGCYDEEGYVIQVVYKIFVVDLVQEV